MFRCFTKVFFFCERLLDVGESDSKVVFFSFLNFLICVNFYADVHKDSQLSQKIRRHFEIDVILRVVCFFIEELYYYNYWFGFLFTGIVDRADQSSSDIVLKMKTLLLRIVIGVEVMASERFGVMFAGEQVSSTAYVKKNVSYGCFIQFCKARMLTTFSLLKSIIRFAGSCSQMVVEVGGWFDASICVSSLGSWVMVVAWELVLVVGLDCLGADF